MQLTHKDCQFQQQKFPITLIGDQLNKATNIGSLFRMADAFGVEKLFFCGDQIDISSPKVKRSARSTEKHINFESKTSIISVLQELQKTHQLIAIEITDSSIPIHKYQFDFEKPIAFIIGSEQHGVSKAALDFCATQLHINMYGNNSSMNVVQATNIVVYEAIKQFSR